MELKLLKNNKGERKPLCMKVSKESRMNNCCSRKRKTKNIRQNRIRQKYTDNCCQREGVVGGWEKWLKESRK